MNIPVHRTCRIAFVAACVLTVSVVCTGICDAQAPSRTASITDHANTFGYTFRAGSTLMIAEALSDGAEFDAAARLIKRRLERSNDDIRQAIQLNNQLQLINAKHLLSAGQAASQHSSIRQKILKEADAIAAKAESDLKLEQSVPSVGDVRLYLEFGKNRALCELARYLTAAKLATVGNKALDAVALQTIHEEIQALNELQASTESRVSELSKQTNSITLQLWINEMYRLVTEIYLLKIDLLAMHMDQIPAANESDRISVASSLRTELASLTAKLGNSPSESPRLSLLRARADASVGEVESAMAMLERAYADNADASLREQNRLLMVDILLSQASAEATEKARMILTRMLADDPSVSAALALTIFRYNLANRGNGTANVSPSQPMDFASPDDLARSLQMSLSAALLTKQKESLGSHYGDYWRLRAEALMLHNAKESAGPAAMEGMELFDAQVQQDLLANRTGQAIQRLTAIEQQANENNDPEKAFTTARQKIALLYKLLRNKEKELGADNTDTIEARLSIAEQCRDAAIKYQAHALAHEELLQSIRIAQGATSKTNADLNKRVLDFVVQTIKDNVAVYANTSSLNPIMQIANVVLASSQDYVGLVGLWEQVAFAQSDSNQPDAELILNSRRNRAIFRTLDLISHPEPTTEKRASGENSLSKEFAEDDGRIVDLYRSLYWSDQISTQSQNTELQAQESALVWVSSLSELRKSLQEKGQVSASPSFDQTTAVGLYEKVVYTTMRQKLVGEYYLNRDVTVPTDLESVSLQEASSDALAKILLDDLIEIQIRGESALLILKGNTEAGLNLFKGYANAQQSTENLLWYGRLLTATNEAHQREASNLLSKLSRKEKVGTPNWFRIKADLILALKESQRKPDAQKEWDMILALVPEAPKAWTSEVTTLLQRP